MEALVAAITYTTLINAWGYGGFANGSDMYELTSYAHYWSSTAYALSNLYANQLRYYNGGTQVRYVYNYTGMQVRCVK
jgi:uncharacterized protein (TIGR02145 family)